MPLPVLLSPLAALGALSVLSPTFWYIGRAAQKLRLPQITGYIAAGILCGPYGLALLSNQSLATFRLVEHTCLAVIAFAAGTELNLGELRRTGKQVTSITVGISLFSWLFTFLAASWLAPSLPFVKARPELTGPVSSLVATIAVARSPASAIAVLNEVSGKGPFCSLIMSVVVVKDVLTFICFALNIGMVAQALEPSGKASGISALRLLAQPILSLVISALLGFVGSALLSVFLRVKVWGQREEKQAIKWVKSGLLVGMAGCMFAAAETLGGEALLACVLMGVAMVNGRSDAASKESAELVEGALHRLFGGLQVVFFGLVGADLKLDVVLGSLNIAFMLWAARLLGVYVGSLMGCMAGGAPPESRRRLWAGMITQAGIALGLAKTVGTRFPDWGPDFAGVVASTVMMNLIAGPPLFKAAVLAVGEARSAEAMGSLSKLKYSGRRDILPITSTSAASPAAKERGAAKAKAAAAAAASAGVVATGGSAEAEELPAIIHAKDARA